MDANVQDTDIGSSAWLGVDEHEPGDEFYERATYFMKSTNWNNLTSLCSTLRDGISCTLGTKFSLGHFNLVREVIFQDGKKWIARLRLPELTSIPDGREMLDPMSRHSMEVATMKYIKIHTAIPVPEIYHADPSPDNAIGAPYILMQYIEGNVASEMRIAKGCPVSLFGTPEQDLNFRRQMADIQAQLACCRFDSIGCIYEAGESEFVIGKDLLTGKGPWTSSAAYYADAATHTLNECTRNAPKNVLESPGFCLPVVFERLIGIVGDKSRISGPFYLTNRDFGSHNVLVNHNFEILAVIDFDGVIAAPAEAVAQFPAFMTLNADPPGYVGTKPLEIERINMTKPKLEEYKSLVREAESRLYTQDSEGKGFADLLLSNAALVYRALVMYQLHADQCNIPWMQWYGRLLRDHIAWDDDTFDHTEKEEDGERA